MSVTYSTGGVVQASGGIYIKRKADDLLLDLCLQGQFAYVLTPRQLGKSSLMANTAAALKERAVRPVIVDLSITGVSEKDIDLWYQSLLYIISKQLNLQSDPFEWWATRRQITGTQRLSEFFEAVVLTEVSDPVVIFVDEIDSILSLEFPTDDFFAAIRAMFNARAINPVLKRLSFVLIGVATPSDLINDPQRTPFNIGEAIHLTDFTFEEALPLAAGLPGSEAARRDILRWVLQWTDGHPYLTQKVCDAIARTERAEWTQEQVTFIVDELFFDLQHGQDNNLRFVSDRLTRQHGDTAPLELYTDIMIGVHTVRVDERSPVQARLKLSGIVKNSPDGSRLIVRNRIYSTVFDRRWIANYITLTREAYTHEPSIRRTPESDDLRARFQVFRAFLTDGRFNDYRQQIAYGDLVTRSARRWQFGTTILMALAGVCIIGLSLANVSIADSAALFWLCITIMIAAPAVALFFSMTLLLGRHQQTRQVLIVTKDDLQKIRRLDPLPEMDLQTYRKSALEASSLTLKTLDLEAGRWGQAIRKPLSVDVFIESAERSHKGQDNVPLDLDDNDSQVNS